MIERNERTGAYEGEARDFIEFLQLVGTPTEPLGEIVLDLKEHTSADDLRQLFSLFRNPLFRTKVETIDSINFWDNTNGLGESVLMKLGGFLENLNPSITKIGLDTDLDLFPLKINPIYASLSTNTHLTQVKLVSPVDVDAALIIANELIPRNPIETFYISCIHLGNQGLCIPLGNQVCSIIMRAAVGEASRIRVLELRHADFTGLDRKVIKPFKRNTRLRRLVLASTRLGDKGANIIAEVLKVNTHLKYIELSDCAFYDCTALGLALQVNESLEELNLSGNYLCYGSSALANALQVNKSLKVLNLWGHTFKDESVCSLISALKYNRTLESLRVYGGTLTESGAQAIVELVQRYCLSLSICISDWIKTRFSRQQDLINLARDFNCRFVESCRRIKDGCAVLDDATIRPLLPLVGSTNLLVKRHVVFLIARQRPEIASQSLRTTSI